MDAVRTRCKFKCVGVEDVEHTIMQAVFEDTDKEAFDALGGHTWENAGRKYRNKPLGRAQNVRLAAQYDTSNPEDLSFAEATPSGELKIYVSNPRVIGSFVPGRNYYLDLIPCE